MLNLLLLKHEKVMTLSNNNRFNQSILAYTKMFGIDIKYDKARGYYIADRRRRKADRAAGSQ